MPTVPERLEDRVFPAYPADYPYYKLPFLGQPFKLVQGDFDVEYAAVTGVKITGTFMLGDVEYPAFTAVIESKITHAFRFYHNAEVGDWKPLSAEQVARQRGAAVLGDTVTRGQFEALATQMRTTLDEVSASTREAVTEVIGVLAQNVALEKRLAASEAALARFEKERAITEPPKPANGTARTQRVG